MKILNSLELASLKAFTPLQLENLASCKIVTVGDLISLKPRKIEQILVWPSNNSGLKPGYKYIQNFEIKQVIFKKSGRGLPYVLLELMYQNQIYQGFLFSRANFILNKLKTGVFVQASVSIFGQNESIFSKNLIVNRLNFINPDQANQLTQVNGKLDLFYPKLSTKVDTTFLRRVFLKLPGSAYTIDLTKLAPTELLGSNTLNLFPLHHPKTLEEFYECSEKLQKVKVFLKTTLQKHLVYTSKKNHLALMPELDLKWMQEVVPKLPVNLTPSQKGAIWEILQEITVVNH